MHKSIKFSMICCFQFNVATGIVSFCAASSMQLTVWNIEWQNTIILKQLLHIEHGRWSPCNKLKNLTLLLKHEIPFILHNWVVQSNLFSDGFDRKPLS